MSALWLKIIAYVTMLIDHVAANLWVTNRSMLTQDAYTFLRCIGRVAFPIFAFQLVEGVKHTKSKGKYLLRLGALALISEIPFDFALNFPRRLQFFDWTSQNVYFTLFLGLVSVIVIQWSGRLPGKKRWIGTLAAGLATVICGLTAKVLCSDYDYRGVLMIAIMGTLTLPEIDRVTAYPARSLIRTGICAVGILVLSYLCKGIEYYALFALIPILLYNGKKGYGKEVQFASYAFYPVHLLVIGLVFVLPKLIR